MSLLSQLNKPLLSTSARSAVIMTDRQNQLEPVTAAGSAHGGGIADVDLLVWDSSTKTCGRYCWWFVCVPQCAFWAGMYDWCCVPSPPGDEANCRYNTFIAMLRYASPRAFGAAELGCQSLHLMRAATFHAHVAGSLSLLVSVQPSSLASFHFLCGLCLSSSSLSAGLPNGTNSRTVIHTVAAATLQVHRGQRSLGAKPVRPPDDHRHTVASVPALLVLHSQTNHHTAAARLAQRYAAM